ncbi:hypothetical protein [Geodermatophilus sp. URMC 62]|uniref:hypothetical protein n=1 Tax=Geodermatophilus sp. URMC 62 TaxID=3423414 RepID=UPI00406C3BA8
MTPRVRRRPPAKGPDAEMSREKAATWLSIAVLALAVTVVDHVFLAPRMGQLPNKLSGAAPDWPAVQHAVPQVRWDLGLLVAFTVAVVLAASLARALFRSTKGRAVADAVLPLGLVTIGAAVLADLCQFIAARTESPVWMAVVTAASVVRWSCLPVVVVAVCAALVVTLARLSARGKKSPQRRPPVTVVPPDPLDGDPPVRWNGVPVHYDTDAAAQAARWRRGFVVPDLTGESPEATRRALQRRGPVSGFCLSGGGIRSASVALGALQSLRPALRRARYLVSVSGGGYTAGAWQLALTEAVDPEHPVPGDVHQNPADVYAPGSAEEDRLRRHVRYLVGSPTEVLVALGVAARSLVLSLAVLFLPAVVLGAVVGLYYRLVPLAPVPPASEEQAPDVLRAP